VNLQPFPNSKTLQYCCPTSLKLFLALQWLALRCACPNHRPQLPLILPRPLRQTPSRIVRSFAVLYRIPRCFFINDCLHFISKSVRNRVQRCLVRRLQLSLGHPTRLNADRHRPRASVLRRSSHRSNKLQLPPIWDCFVSVHDAVHFGLEPIGDTASCTSFGGRRHRNVISITQITRRVLNGTWGGNSR
jgi:hypothetical protein